MRSEVIVRREEFNLIELSIFTLFISAPVEESVPAPESAPVVAAEPASEPAPIAGNKL